MAIDHGCAHVLMVQEFLDGPHGLALAQLLREKEWGKACQLAAE
jgi:hypothetical protein